MSNKLNHGTVNSSSNNTEDNAPQFAYSSGNVNSIQPQPQHEDEIDLAELWFAIWSGKLLIIVISAVFAVSSIFYALSQPNIYKASTLLAPVSKNGAGGLAKMAGQFGGLASLAGINLGGGGTNKTGLALEVLKSRLFIENFISKYQLLVPLMAAKNWDMKNDKLIINDKIYDETNNKWMREVKAPKTPEPSSWEAFKAFTKLLTVSSDKATGMITISINHYSPTVAKQWLILLVTEINNTIREQEKTEAQGSIDFLSDKLEETQLADMQTVFYQLIEEQTKTIMLAEVSKEYVLKTIDPANVPDEKDSPKRALIVVLGTMLGSILSVLFVLIRYFTNKDTASKYNNTDSSFSNASSSNTDVDRQEELPSNQALDK